MEQEQKDAMLRGKLLKAADKARNAPKGVRGRCLWGCEGWTKNLSLICDGCWRDRVNLRRLLPKQEVHQRKKVARLSSLAEGG